MKPGGQKLDPVPARRRYLVHLLCIFDREYEGGRYIARISPWAARSGFRSETCERAFADECDLIATVNPLLPRGSDVRDVFEHIESQNGFYYLLQLSGAEAARLGWGREGSPEDPA